MSEANTPVSQYAHRLYALYLILLGLIILALWNPTLPWKITSFDLFILLDDSFSMDERKRDADWLDISNATNNLPHGSRISLLRFATTSVEQLKRYKAGEKDLAALSSFQQTLSETTVDSTASNIEAAINHALRITTPNRNNILLLITDGQENIGDAERALRAAKKNGIAVYGFRPKKISPQKQASIAAMILPTRARQGERIPVDITISSNSTGKAQLQLLLDGLSVSEIAQTLQTGKTQFRTWLNLDNSGANLVELRMRSINNKQENFDSRKAIVNVQGLVSILYVSGHSEVPPLARSLQAGGFSVRTIQPKQFPQNDDALKNVSTVVLDDIAITDIPESAWQSLVNAIQNQGTGLLVLGGLHSFGAGAYRHSLLESILPVTAEGRQKRQQTAVQFLVDKSGSMDRGSTGISRLALARQSVLATSQALADDDLLGLLTFDVTPHELLPLTRYPSPATAIESAWTLAPGGGTRLDNALDLAIKNLEMSGANQKLLVLVTDGFVRNEELRPLEQRITAAGIDLIALAVGNEVETSTLQRLTRINNGKLVSIQQIARLPRIMREEVEKRRNPAKIETTRVISDVPLPFLPNNNIQWPPVSGYMVTSPRKEATVYLHTKNNDPLLAMHYAGAGKVLALPAGLGDWAQRWQTSPAWGRFAGGLVTWVAANHYDPAIYVEVIDHPGYLEFVVDSLTENLEWVNSKPVQIQVRDPLQQTHELTLPQIAPGRYQGKLAIHHPGRYSINVRHGNKSAHYELLHGTHSEMLSDFQTEDHFTHWLDAGLIKPWLNGQPLQPTNRTPNTQGIRSPVTALILLLFLLLIIFERGLNQWLSRKRLSNGLRKLQQIITEKSHSTHNHRKPEK